MTDVKSIAGVHDLTGEGNCRFETLVESPPCHSLSAFVRAFVLQMGHKNLENNITNKLQYKTIDA
jgi:hypothetical protein